MATYIARRVAASVLLLFLVLSLTFFFIHLAPGDPSEVFEDPRIAPEHHQRLRAAYGLDRPLAERYLSWLKAVTVDFDWGVSFSHQQPVARVMLRTLPATLLLAGAALVVQFGLGLGLGVVAARRAGSRTDHAIRFGSLVLYSVPAFWLALMMVLAFSHTLPAFPSGQMRSVGASDLGPGWRFLDLLHHLALPALTLGIAATGGVVRFTRAGLLDVLGHDYIRTARALGVSEPRVLWVHALRNAVAPVIQLLGLSLPFLLSGALVVEIVFSWPGMGRLTFQAIASRDYPLILAGTALAGTMVVAGNLLADLLHAVVDPRVSHER